jgi:cytochrome c-type biogenesis protein
MATSNLPTSQEERNFPWRAFFMGLGLMLLVGVIIVLSMTNESAQLVSTNNRSLLTLAPAMFLVGIVSFLSPCTLPILPAYFAFTFQARRDQVVLTTIAFFLGLATTMTILGASATAFGQLLYKYTNTITFVGGILVIILGVTSLLGKGFSGIKVLDRPSATIAGSYLYGMTFAFGWTACIGPILGAMYTILLSTQGLAILQGAILAFIYALGLSLPLILIATFFSRLGNGSKFWQMLKGKGFDVKIGSTTLYLHTTNIISGLLLIFMGALLASGQLTAMTQWAQTTSLGQWTLGIEEFINQLFGGR